MYTDSIRKQIWTKIQSNRTLLLELGSIVDGVIDENNIDCDIYGDDIVYITMDEVSQVLADELEHNTNE